ncbi:MAG: type II toxin-antitoxin system MqsA family antitoxin [Candidatus Rokuibacteriota bacterium]
MKCVVCKHGETRPGTTTVTLTREGTTLVVKGVPACVCSNCGEEYVDDATTGRLLAVAEQAAQSGVEVEVRDYVAPMSDGV